MNVNASATRNVGSAMNVSIIRARKRLPGNGVNAISTDNTKPSTRHPAVAESAIVSVLRIACRNSADDITAANLANDSAPASPPSAWRAMSASGKKNSAARIRSGGAIHNPFAFHSTPARVGAPIARSATNGGLRNERCVRRAEMHGESRTGRGWLVHRRTGQPHHVAEHVELDVLHVALPLNALHDGSEHIARLLCRRQPELVRAHAQKTRAAV